MGFWKERELTAYVCYMTSHDVLKNKTTQKLWMFTDEDSTIRKGVLQTIIFNTFWWKDCWLQSIVADTLQGGIILAKNTECICLRTLDLFQFQAFR